MARVKKPARIIKQTDIIGLTRFRLTCHRSQDGNPVRIRPDIEFESTHRFLKTIPGYEYLQAARRLEDPDQVLLCTYWVDEISLRAFIESAGYETFLRILGLGDTKETDASHGPIITIAELKHSSMASCDIATIFTAAFVPSTEPDTSKLAYLELDIPYSIYEPQRLVRPLPTSCGWILDLQVEDGRPVKKGIMVQEWAHREPFEKQLEIYKAVKQDAESRKEQRLKLEELRVVSVEEMTWDFGNPDEMDESVWELDDEGKLVEKIFEMKV